MTGWQSPTHEFSRSSHGLKVGAVSLLAMAAAHAASAQTRTQDAAGPPTSTAPVAARQGSTLSEVVVTARRREESVQRVPQTVTAISPQQLKQQNITNVLDLTYAAPSLSVATNFTTLNSSFVVRGLATGVTTYFSDAPCCGAVSNQPFMDIAQVQVLNGPQGTLFGRSSAAGAVLIDPVHPDLNNYSAYVEGILGDYNRAQFTGVANIPIIKDHLAIRLAANSNSVLGYTNEIGTGYHLDGINNQQYRVGIEAKWGHFDNYLVGQYFNVNESGSSELLTGSVLNYPLYNIPASAGPGTFGAICAQAVSYGLAKDVNSCVTQRVDILHRIQSTLVEETNRLAGGGSALRQALPSYDAQPEFNSERRFNVIDIAQYTFDDLPILGKLNVRNIFSVDSFTSMVGALTDGLGGIAEESSFTETNQDGGSNQRGNVQTTFLPPFQTVINDEFQLRGDVRDGLFTWAVGNFYSHSDTPKSLNGTGVTYKIFGGVFTPNLGYNSADGFSDGGYADEEAVYAQGTLNLDKVGVHGLSVTGGYRESWDKTSFTTFAEQFNYPSGLITPDMTAQSTASTKSNGYNYTVSAQEQITPDLMVYFTQSRAYVPGGINPRNPGTDTLPNFTQTYSPETVLNREGGVKYQFRLGGVQGRLNVAGYWDDFTNIVEAFTGVVGGSSVIYYENAAAAKLHGVEVAATLIPFRRLTIDGAYNYNSFKYTHWIGQDPFNKAAPGDPVCLPSSPPNSCYIDLSNNPAFLMPNNQGHITVRYDLPLDQRIGDVSLSATGYAQSRVYFVATAARDLQLEPSDLNSVSQAPYYTLNVRADWRDVDRSGWNLAVFVNNATDQVYATGKASQTITLGYAIANYAPPRMFGVEVSRKFGP